MTKVGASSIAYVHSESVVRSIVLTAQKQTPKTSAKRQKFYSLEYFKRLKYYFGSKFLFFLANSYLCLKGASNTILSEIDLVHFEWLGFDSQARTRNSLIINIPWSIKGLIGAVSDTLPLFGYYKSSWMIIYGSISCVAALLLGAFPRSVLIHAPITHSLYLFAMLSCSAFDLLCEGKYTQIMIDHPETRGDIVSFIWFIQSVGGIIIGVGFGSVLDAFGAIPLFYVVFVFNFQILVFTMFNFLDEKKCLPHLKNKFDIEKLHAMGPYFIIAILCGILIISSLFVGLFLDAISLLIYNFCIAVIILAASYFLLPLKLSNVNLFMLITSALFPSFGKPLTNWYTGNEKCVPGGPQFSYTYFQTINISFGNAGQVIAIIIFQAYMSHWKLRTLYWFSALLCGIASFNDFVILKRWNVTHLKIPDVAMYLIGNGIVAGTVSMLNFLPTCILLSRMCPKSIEATAYAILAAYSNFGLSLASSVGLYLQEILKINLKGDNCSYDALPVAILIGSCVMYPLSIPISWWLIPPYRASDPSRPEDVDLSSSLIYRFRKWKANRQEKKEQLELTLNTSPVSI